MYTLYYFVIHHTYSCWNAFKWLFSGPASLLVWQDSINKPFQGISAINESDTLQVSPGDSVNNKLFKFLCVHTITDRMTRSKWRSRWFNYLSSLTVHIKLPYRMGKIWDCRLADQDLEKHILNVETLFCMRDHNVDISYTAFFNVIISVPIHVPLVCVDIAHKR